ncbi:MAG: DUF2933 domain-containing protein [Chloroflexota bacterium]
MNILRMCLDPRVLAAMGVAGIAVWLIAPQAVLAALPLLLLAVCPLSMALLVWSMRGHGASDPTTRLGSLEREQAKLGEEIARARAELASASARPERSTEREPA